MKKTPWRSAAFVLVVLVAASGPRCPGRIPVGGVPRVVPPRVPIRPPAVPVRPVKPPVAPLRPRGIPGGIPPERPPVGGRIPIRKLPEGVPLARPILPLGIPAASRSVTVPAADALAERAGSLELIHVLGQNKDWPALHRLVAAEAEVRGLPSELRQELLALRTPARKLEILTRCRAALGRTGAGLPPGIDELPESLQKDFRALLALDDLGAALGKSWPKPPDVPAVQRHLAAVGALDEKLALRLKLHLALKAGADGHGEAAAKLLPSAKELESAGPELRDLKAVARSEPGGGAGKHGPPPPDPLPPPEPPPGGTRPGVKESLRADLPGLTKEVDAEKARVQARVREGIENESGLHAEHLAHPLHRVLEYARKGREQEKERQKKEAGREEAVSKQVGRRLTNAERVLVRVMGRQGKTPAEMAKILSELTPAPQR